MLNRCLYILLFATLLTACGEHAGVESIADAADGLGLDAGGDATNVDIATGCVPPNGVQDVDQDGLLDAIEDANLNCRVDEGETDPGQADSDGDGLLDGDEDVDRDGVWDEGAGEHDPRRADTDGDGELDGDELIASVCTSSLLTIGSTVAMGDRIQRVYLPTGWEVAGRTERGNGLAVSERGVAIFGHDLSAEALPVERFASVATSALAGSGWQFGEVALSVDEGVASELHMAVIDSGGGTGTQPVPISDVFSLLAQQAFGESSTDALLLTAPNFTSEAVVRYTVDRDGPGFVLTVVEPHAGLGRPELARTDQSRLRAHCEVGVATDLAEDLHVFVALDTLGTRTTAETVMDTLMLLEAERSLRGLRTRVWLTRGDAHLNGAPGVPVLADSADPAAWRRSTQSLFGGHIDQRVWLNLASLEQRARLSDDMARLYIVGLSREDSEFRMGALNGRDGNPTEAALPVGEMRSALTNYYGQQLNGPVYVFAPLTQDTSNLSCVDPYGPGTPIEPAASGAQLAMLTGGAFVERCTPLAAERLLEALATSGWVWPTTSLSFVPIPSTVRVADPDAGVAVSTVNEGNLVRAPFAAGTVEIAGAYLYWDDGQ
ncbi:MAG: hypothetical protein ACI81R_000714 [Bradymonadia bacterium]|jgi:hypothetical protein